MFPDGPFSTKAAGTTGAAFLKIPHGARYQSLGGAAAAAAEGSESLFWNPAGLGRVTAETPADLAISYSNLLEGSYAGAASYALPRVGPGTLAAGVVYFSQSSLTSYNNVGDASGSFAPNDLALILGYGAPLGSLRVGGALKAVRSAIAEVSGMTAALDAGIQADHVADVGDGPLDVGAAIANLGAPIKVGSVASPLPFAARVGADWHASPALSVLLDVNLPVDQDPYVSFGGELGFKQPGFGAALRLGFNQSTTRSVDGLTGITAGGGLDMKGFRLDYAWVPYGDLGMTNRVTLGFRF